MKPLNQKSYGSIGHLPGSRSGKGDHCVPEGQAKIATLETRDLHDTVIVQEKLDGSCCAVAKVNGVIFPLTRSGTLACQSPYVQHQLFYNWCIERHDLFDTLLGEGERVVGEWLAMVHSTRYVILSDEEVFRVFDLMTGNRRERYEVFMSRVAGKLQTAPLLSYGPPRTPQWIMDHFPISGSGAEQVEGWVWRVERKGEVDFLAKYVRLDYTPGALLPDITGKPPVYNWRP